MIAIATVLIVMLVSLLIARVATVALTLTGLSRDAARFQARSALSGTGFTTNEAESVVGHPVRRRVVMTLMLIGSAGLVTVLASLMISFANADRQQTLNRLLILVAGLFLLFLASRSPWVDRRLSWLIAKVLTRWTDLEARDYSALLHLGDRFAVGEMTVREGDWVAGRALSELNLREEGVIVLGLTVNGGTWIGSPTFDTEVRPGDCLLVYGPAERLAELDRRRAGPEGDQAHAAAVEGHGELVRDLAGRARR